MFAADHHQILASRLILLTFLLVNHVGMQSPSVGLVYLYNNRIKPTFLKHKTQSQSINIKCNILSFPQKLPSMSFGLAHFNVHMSFLYTCKARMRTKETVNVKNTNMRLSMNFLFPFFYHLSLTMRLFVFVYPLSCYSFNWIENVNNALCRVLIKITHPLYKTPFFQSDFGGKPLAAGR